MTSIKIPMHWVKETKNTNRYEADGLSNARDVQGVQPPVDCVYLQKASVPGLTPRKVMVTVEFD